MSGSTGVVIAGTAETDQIGRLPCHSTMQLHVEGALNAVADAGLSLRDIDGIATVSSPGPVQVAHALGITPDWIDGTGSAAPHSCCMCGMPSRLSGPGTPVRS